MVPRLEISEEVFFFYDLCCLGFDFLFDPSRSLVWMTGSFKERDGGRVVETLSIGCLGSGKWCFSFSSFTLCRTDVC